MPTTISECKAHPVYVLERHLKQTEVLYPAHNPVGHVRGEPVFRKEFVKPLFSRVAWRRQGRDVIENSTPAKIIKARVMTKNKKRDVEEKKAQRSSQTQQDEETGLETGEMSGLFGEWQTEYVTPPPLVNGKIPKNEYGTFDLFHPRMLPPNATHIPFPPKTHLVKIANTLGVEFAIAVVSFEFRAGRAIPVHQGIVVASESTPLILEALDIVLREERDRELRKREERVWKNWKRILKGIVRLQRLRQEYLGDQTAVPVLGTHGVSVEQAHEVNLEITALVKDFEAERGNEDEGIRTGTGDGDLDVLGETYRRVRRRRGQGGGDSKPFDERPSKRDEDEDMDMDLEAIALEMDDEDGGQMDIDPHVLAALYFDEEGNDDDDGDCGDDDEEEDWGSAGPGVKREVGMKRPRALVASSEEECNTDNAADDSHDDDVDENFESLPVKKLKRLRRNG